MTGHGVSETVGNGSSFLQRLAVDMVAAASASIIVSPFITVVDRSIIENASGAKKLADGLKDGAASFLKRPHEFIKRKEFLLIWGLYTSTYITANAIDTVAEETGNTENSVLPKFLGTSAVNMTLCIAKDREFARMFGVITPTKVPLLTYAMFACRDGMTVAASFTAPKMVANELVSTTGMPDSRALTTAQLLCPAAIQFLSTPLHLYGLDTYNNKDHTRSQRVSFVSREYLKSTFARIGRIGPAFGIGGVGNNYFRNKLRSNFDLN